jgi:hypothetical protein
MISAFRAGVAALLGAIAVSSCRPSEEQASGRTSATADTTGGMAGMTGMARHPGMMSAAMMDSMHAHMSMLDTMSASKVKSMLPVHRQMVERMLSQMNSEMQSMKMPAGVPWTATADSVRRDLEQMSAMSGQELKSTMSAHHGRLMRLMQMHRDMTSPTR